MADADGRAHFVLCGCQQIAADILRLLHDHPRCIVDRVYASDAARDHVQGLESLREVAVELSLPCSSEVGTARMVADLRNRPDYLVSAYYRRILSPQVLKMPLRGALNVHPSRLPDYRGPTPTAWALIKGEREVGISIHAVEEGIDTGPIVAQRSVAIDAEDTGFTLHCKAMAAGVELFASILPTLIDGGIVFQRQVGVGSYYGQLAALGRQIRWYEEAELVARTVRCFARPFAGVCATLLGRQLVIHGASVTSHPEPLQGPGRLVDIRKNDRLVVSCADGFIEIHDYHFVEQPSESERELLLRSGNRFAV